MGGTIPAHPRRETEETMTSSPPDTAAPPPAPRSRGGTIVAAVVRTIVGGGAILAAIGVASMLFSTREVLTPKPPEEARPRLVVVEALPRPVQRTFTGFGTAASLRQSDVPAEVVSIVESIPDSVVEGRDVAAGEILMRLDARDFNRQAEIAAETLAELDTRLARLDIEEVAARERLELAERDVELARSDLERTRKALEDGAAVEREVERSQQSLIISERGRVQARELIDSFPQRRLALEALLERQRAQKRLAEQNLERCVVRSPIDGVLAAIDVEPGESVAPGMRVARVVDLSAMEVPLQLPAAARRFVRAGDVVRLVRDSDAAQAWSAAVVRINPVDAPGSRTFTAYAELEQDPADPLALVPGTFLAGTVAAGTPLDRVVLPRRSVRDGRVLRVGRDAEGVPTVETLPVEVAWTFEEEISEFGLRDTQWVVLSEGTADALGDRALVLLDGSRAVAPGTSVRPVRTDGSEPAAARIAGGGTPAP